MFSQETSSLRQETLALRRETFLLRRETFLFGRETSIYLDHSRRPSQHKRQHVCAKNMSGDLTAAMDSRFRGNDSLSCAHRQYKETAEQAEMSIFCAPCGKSIVYTTALRFTYLLFTYLRFMHQPFKYQIANVKYQMPQPAISSIIRSVARRAEISALGMPVPGRVLAPAKYRLW